MRMMACLFLVGCGGSDGFEQAVPSRSQVTINVPEEKPLGTSSLNQALLGRGTN